MSIIQNDIQNSKEIRTSEQIVFFIYDGDASENIKLDKVRSKHRIFSYISKITLFEKGILDSLSIYFSFRFFESL